MKLIDVEKVYGTFAPGKFTNKITWKTTKNAYG